MNGFCIRIETGSASGTVREIPPEGLSVGRSAQNDLALQDDALLSRRHCRFHVENGTLFVADLATVNGTQVDGVSIERDTAVAPGSTIVIGETRIAVGRTGDDFAASAPGTPPPGTPPPAPAPATPAPAPAAPAPPPPERKPLPLFPSRGAAASETDSARRGGARAQLSSGAKLVSNVGFACGAIVLLALAVKLFVLSPAAPRIPPPDDPPPEPPFAFSYVKLEGSPSNVFRYEMDLGEDGALLVAIDDVAQARHVRKRTESPLPADRVAELQRLFENASLPAFAPGETGRASRNFWREIRISALLHGKPATAVFRNHDEPPAVLALREALEDFGRNELGLWAFAVDRDTLLAGAEEDFERATRLHEEREVLPGNLFEAVRIFDSCLARLETLDPRPELHARAKEGRAAAAAELDARVEALNWRAEHAANVKDWAGAADALRSLLETVPDRSDPRHDAAARRLLDAESRIGRK